eukprot:TRINITY_DN7856_c0_g7_i1.p1 TRINITY_DN7856_c0_g7~~TRINITY_DN7856_c0_g7_i1.p1  ORF type:complete len:118 (-),score=10.39 TRINITY_DN7856_c0_g7_i1:230-559(-)
MIRRPPRSTHCISSAASDVYKRQQYRCSSIDRIYKRWNEGYFLCVALIDSIVGTDRRSRSCIGLRKFTTFFFESKLLKLIHGALYGSVPIVSATLTFTLLSLLEFSRIK